MTRCSPNPQVASYGVKPKYGLVTYATVPKILIRVSDENSSDADWVTRAIDNIDYEGQRLGKGLVGSSLWGQRSQKVQGCCEEEVVRPSGKAGWTTLQSMVGQQAH